MISFTCRKCGRPAEAEEAISGSQVPCDECGTLLTVPFDIPCEGGPVSPDAKTLTAFELKALSLDLRGAK
jgi:hypothetical protein